MLRTAQAETPLVNVDRNLEIEDLATHMDLSSARHVVGGLEDHIVLLVPIRCPAVQLGQLLWKRVLQAQVDDIGKKVVVAIPLPPVVQRDDEQVHRF